MSTLKQRFIEISAEKPGISQAEVARATGTKPPSVSGWFSGKTKTMKFETAVRAASLYGVSALWLAKGEGVKHADGMAHQASQVINMPPDISNIMANLGAYLEPLEAADRDEALRMMARLVKEPGAHAKVASAIEGMVSEAFARGVNRKTA